MNVGFYLTDAEPSWIGVMVQSVREYLPTAKLVQLTDETTSEVKGVDAVRRLPRAPLSLHRPSHYASVQGHWLFIDTDVVIQQDVSDVFASWSFDVALADRKWTNYHGRERAGAQQKYADTFPFNAGVAFSTGPAFWSEVLRYVRMNKALHHNMNGDQYAMGVVAQRNQFKVKVLPGMVYNFPPEAPDDPDIPNAAIVHYKGKARKRFLSQRLQAV